MTELLLGLKTPLVEKGRRQVSCVHDLVYALPNPQRVQQLQIRKAPQENDAIDKSIGVAHFLYPFLAPLLRESVKAPIVEPTSLLQID